MDRKTAENSIGKTVKLMCFSGDYIGRLIAVNESGRARVDVQILAPIKLDPVRSALPLDYIKDQGGVNVSLYEGDVPTYQEAMDALRDKLDEQIARANSRDKMDRYGPGYANGILARMRKLHFG